MKVDANAVFIIDELEKRGYKAYVVGGAVRDFLMDITPSDYDIATSATPCEVKGAFEKCQETGLQHGTITVLINHKPYEVTSFRTEGKYTDNRRPDSVEFVTDIKTDLMRRDFTINAMAYNPKEGILDFFGGKQDIENKLVRCVGSPLKRFDEDSLRMLRAIRFATTLDFNIDEKTLAAIREKRNKIKNISSERIKVELDKMLVSDNLSHIKTMYITGLLENIIPELWRCFNTPQKNRYHIYNVGEHTIKAVENIEKNADLRWAALFHDVGKPSTLEIDKQGITHFYTHAQKSVEISNNIMKRLKFSTKQRETVLTLVKYHDIAIKPEKEGIKQLLNKIGKEHFIGLLKLQKADILAKSPECQEYKLSYLDSTERIFNEIIKNNEPYMISMLEINGSVLIQNGFSGNSDLGRILNKLLFEVIKNPTLNKRDKLIKLANNIAKTT